MGQWKDEWVGLWLLSSHWLDEGPFRQSCRTLACVLDAEWMDTLKDGGLPLSEHCERMRMKGQGKSGFYLPYSPFSEKHREQDMQIFMCNQLRINVSVANFLSRKLLIGFKERSKRQKIFQKIQVFLLDENRPTIRPPCCLYRNLT